MVEQSQLRTIGQVLQSLHLELLHVETLQVALPDHEADKAQVHEVVVHVGLLDEGSASVAHILPGLLKSLHSLSSFLYLLFDSRVPLHDDLQSN